MKKIIVCMLAGLCPLAALRAQTFAEWFSQKKTQIQYLAQQIAAFESYAGQLEKGYGIVKSGTDGISSVKHGDFTLHSNYFNSLSTVNPAVSGDPRVKEIMALDQGIVDNYHACYGNMQQAGYFSNDEISEAYATFSNLMKAAAAGLDELSGITTSGSYQMTDRERLKRIDAIYVTMQHMYKFSADYRRSSLAVGLQRKAGLDDVDETKAWYGLK